MIASSLAASPSPKKTICLNMIVKNEKEVIERCLQSVLPIIDSWVIVDTGSTDGTQQIIKSFMKNIPGELHEKPWVNFGYNREEALQLAKSKADYILFMDADDILAFAKDFQMPALTEGFYIIPTHSNGMECLLPRLIATNLDWHWEGVLHERITIKDNTKGCLLNGLEYVYVSDGARTKDSERYLKDIKILLKGIKDEPNNSAYVFYLAKTYQFAGDPENSIKYYEKRAEMGGFPEEVFCSKLEIARIRDRQNMESKLVEASYLNAYEYRPSRIEPLYYIVNKARLRGEFQKGYDITELAITIIPTDSLFVEKWIYDYGLLFEYAVCAYELQKYPESLDACQKLLALPQLPEIDKKTIQNLYEETYKQNSLRIQQEIVSITQI
ncbi:MAG: glycosyltransferase [Parachlamydiaceae bacterium]